MLLFPVLCLSEQIRFCAECERILDSKGDLQSYRKQISESLANYFSTQVNDPILALKLRALMLDVIHNVAILDQLIQHSPWYRIFSV